MRIDVAVQCARIAELPEALGRLEAGRLGMRYARIQVGCASCWVSHQSDKTVISIKGSVSKGRKFRNSQIALRADLVPWLGAGLVHEGYFHVFWRLLKEIRQQIEKSNIIYFIGHSQGAAVATLMGAHFGAQRVMVFGSPKVGNQEFCQNFPNQTRVSRYENRGDILTKYPLNGVLKEGGFPTLEPYGHVGRRIRLNGFGHSMDAYLQGVRKSEQQLSEGRFFERE